MDKKALMQNISKTPRRALTTIKEKQKRAFTTIRTKQKKAFSTIRQKQKQAFDNMRDQMQRRKRVIVKLIILTFVVTIISITIGRSLFFDQKPGLYSFAIINFSGYLFFLMMPVEILFPYYLSEGHIPALLIGTAVITATIALLINYFIGTLASSAVINDLIGEKRYLKAKSLIDRFGLVAVFIFNLFPLSGDLVVLMAGILRLNLGWVILWSVAGLTIKYVAMTYLFSLF